MSSVGNDTSGSVLLENLKKLGMNTSGIKMSDNLSTAAYSAVLDSTGDMDAAIADMSAFESIVSVLCERYPAYFSVRLSNITRVDTKLGKPQHFRQGDR